MTYYLQSVVLRKQMVVDSYLAGPGRTGIREAVRGEGIGSAAISDVIEMCDKLSS